MTLNLPVSSRLTLLTGLTVLLAACGGTSSPKPAPTPTPTEVSGEIPGRITPFVAGDAASVAPDYLSISAPVDSTGTFRLALPKAMTMNITYDDVLVPATEIFGNCTDPQLTAPAGMEFFPINKLSTDKGQTLVSEPVAGASPYTYRGWWYADTSATVTFRGTDCLLLGDTDTTLDFKFGWNVVLVSTDGKTATYRIAAQPTTPVEWQPFASSGMAAQGLSPDILTPWRAFPRYQNR